MYFDAANFIGQVSEIAPRLAEEHQLTLSLVLLVDEALADHYKSVISRVAGSENVEDASKHALAFARALDDRHFNRCLIAAVSEALLWYIGYYYRCNRWESSEYVGDAYRRRVLRVGALAQCGGDQGEKIDKIYDECWRRWGIEADDLDWDVEHHDTSPRCARRPGKRGK